MSDLADLGVVDLAARFASGSATPVDALEARLARIARDNSWINAIVAMDEPGARAAARASALRWREGRPLSAIDGAVIGVKANFAIEGLPWTAAIEAFRNRIADEDAFVVAALRRAGAIVLGSLNMHEGALGATTTSPLYGPCINPLRDGFTPGGSSGGSAAAVCAGFVAGALGSDTMGSVRIPAAYTGTYGLKPSFGRASRRGLELLSQTLDHVGVHARSAEDLRAIFKAIDVFDPQDPYACPFVPTAVSPKGRLGLLETPGVTLTPPVAEAFDRAIDLLTSSGVEFVKTKIDDYDFSRFRRKGLLVLEAEGAASLASARSNDPNAVSPAFASMLDYGARQSAEAFAAARDMLLATRRAARRIFAEVDAVICPTAPQVAFSHSDVPSTDQADLTAFANFAGLPALATPLPSKGTDLPASLQIIGPEGQDDLVLDLAEAISARIHR